MSSISFISNDWTIGQAHCLLNEWMNQCKNSGNSSQKENTQEEPTLTVFFQLSHFPTCKLEPAGISQFSSVQSSHSVVSDCLWPHESQHTRPPCPSPTPGVHSDSRPSSQWCHPAISSSVIPFSSCPQPLPASESFPMSWLWSAKLKPCKQGV